VTDKGIGELRLTGANSRRFRLNSATEAVTQKQKEEQEKDTYNESCGAELPGKPGDLPPKPDPWGADLHGLELAGALGESAGALSGISYTEGNT
jgi:hypothetical protein